MSSGLVIDAAKGGVATAWIADEMKGQQRDAGSFGMNAVQPGSWSRVSESRRHDLYLSFLILDITLG